MNKAVFIDYKRTDIPKKYLQRVTKLFKLSRFIARNDSKLLNEVKDADVIFAKIFTKIDKEVINAAPNLKYIGVFSTAFNEINANYARKKGVTVCNLGGYSTGAVAEFAVATILEQTRELERAKNHARKEKYTFAELMGVELGGRTLGVIGAGRIGSRIAEIGLGFGMDVFYFSRRKKPEIEKKGAKKKSLDKVLSESDFIALALVLNKQTEKIISKQKINLLKKGCVFVNIAPPDLIDQDAIMKKAGNGDIVFIFDQSDNIPPTLAKNFLKTKNCVVYPHIAFRTEEANTARLEIFSSNIENFLKGKSQNVVN